MNHDRVIRLYTYYQSETIHPMAEKTGVPVEVLLHGEATNKLLDSTYTQGSPPEHATNHTCAGFLLDSIQ